MRYRFLVSVACAFVLTAVAGCRGTLPSSHGYVLVRRAGDNLVALNADDPLYAVFDAVMSGPLVKHLLSLFEGTCGGFSATNLSSRTPQTLRNYLVIVITGDDEGLLRDVRVQEDGRTVRVEYAVALGLHDETDLGQARRRMPTLMAQLLLAVAGLEPPTTLADAPPDCACMSERMALWQGYAALQDERASISHGGEDVRGLSELSSDRDRWACCPTADQHTDDMRCVCGRGAAGFLAELLAGMPATYPQRYMLWFANFEASETRDAKLLLAFARMDPEGGLDHFVASYADTYPAEADRVRELDQTWRSWMSGDAP